MNAHTRSSSSLLVASLLTMAMVFTLLLLGCPSPEENDAPDDIEEATGLSQWELEHGIGPITESLELDEEIDEDLAAQGDDLYATLCESCHRMEARFVGPPLGKILEARTPEFVMNFMLNPQEMIREHPIGQELLAEYMVEMPYQNVSEEEARAILEYLRAESSN